MRKRFDDLVVMQHAPTWWAAGGYRRDVPMLAYCSDSRGNGWRYDPDRNCWQGLVDPLPEDIARGAAGTIADPDSSVLLIVDNTRESVITLPPSATGGPVTIASENCDVVIVKALSPELFPLVLRNLLDFAGPGKRAYFGELWCEPVMKVDDLMYMNLRGDDLSGDFDPEKCIQSLREMPVCGREPMDSGENHRLVEELRFVECFLTGKERGLANLLRSPELGSTSPEIDILFGYPDPAELSPEREKELWKRCSRVVAGWGRSEAINKPARYSQIPSFFSRAALEFEIRSLGLMDQSRIMVGEIERAIHRVVFALLERRDGVGFWKGLRPSSVRKQAEDFRRRDLHPEHPSHYLFLKDYKQIIESNWKLFESYFTLPSWGEYDRIFPWLFRENLRTYPPIRWFDALCFLRNRICHPTRNPLTPGEFGFLEGVIDHVKVADP